MWIRLALVLAAMWPLFALWGLKGNKVLSDEIFIPICATFIILPQLLSWLYLRQKKIEGATSSYKILRCSDQREHIITYLFAMLIPLFDANLDTSRDLIAVSAATIFVVVIFTALNLYYTNLLFLFTGRHIFVVYAETTRVVQGRLSSDEERLILVTKRSWIGSNSLVHAYRLAKSDVMMEDTSHD